METYQEKRYRTSMKYEFRRAICGWGIGLSMFGLAGYDAMEIFGTFRRDNPHYNAATMEYEALNASLSILEQRKGMFLDETTTSKLEDEVRGSIDTKVLDGTIEKTKEDIEKLKREHPNVPEYIAFENQEDDNAIWRAGSTFLFSALLVSGFAIGRWHYYKKLREEFLYHSF